jgi:hypothetical protein
MAYIVQLQGAEIQYIRVYSAGILLARTNLRACKCVDCAQRLKPGDGVYRRAYQANGFLCQDCLSKFLKISTYVFEGDGDAGFRLDPAFRWLVACLLGPRQFTTAEVIRAITKGRI